MMKEDCEAMIALAVAAVRDRTLAEAEGKIRTMVGDREEEAHRKGRGFSDFARVLSDAAEAIRALRSKPENSEPIWQDGRARRAKPKEPA